MGMIKLLAAPVRRIVKFPLFQLAFVVAVILFLQAGDDKSARGQIFNGVDELVESTVGLFSAAFNVKSFTKSWLTTGFWIAYVYLACLLILSLLRVVIRKMVDFAGWSNLFGLRNAIARERGIAAYRAWVPLERIRPASIPQEKWEETFAWPANNEPPYPPRAQRVLGGVISYVTVGLLAAVLLQVFTPFPVLTWLGQLMKMLVVAQTRVSPVRRRALRGRGRELLPLMLATAYDLRNKSGNFAMFTAILRASSRVSLVCDEDHSQFN